MRATQSSPASVVRRGGAVRRRRGGRVRGGECRLRGRAAQPRARSGPRSGAARPRPGDRPDGRHPLRAAGRGRRHRGVRLVLPPAPARDRRRRFLRPGAAHRDGGDRGCGHHDDRSQRGGLRTGPGQSGRRAGGAAAGGHPGGRRRPARRGVPGCRRRTGAPARRRLQLRGPARRPAAGTARLRSVDNYRRLLRPVDRGHTRRHEGAPRNGHDDADRRRHRQTRLVDPERACTSGRSGRSPPTWA